MTKAKICNVCNKSFANKSNLNRHAIMHKKITGKKNVVADVSMKQRSKHDIQIKSLNNILWKMLIHLIENKHQSNKQSFRRKLALL